MVVNNFYQISSDKGKTTTTVCVKWENGWMKRKESNVKNVKMWKCGEW